MRYSALFSALGLSVLLSACAHGAQTAPAHGHSAAIAQSSAEIAQAEKPSRLAGLRTRYLAYQDHPHTIHSGDVITEHRVCDVWSSNASERCDLTVLVNESMAHGTANVW